MRLFWPDAHFLLAVAAAVEGVGNVPTHNLSGPLCSPLPVNLTAQYRIPDNHTSMIKITFDVYNAATQSKYLCVDICRWDIYVVIIL